MAEPRTLEERARIAARDAAAARRRSLARRAAGPLFWKYVKVVPSVFSASGEFAAFRLHVPGWEALRRLGNRAVLTLDSATEVLGGFRLSQRGLHYAYFADAEGRALVESLELGERLPGDRFPLTWAPRGMEVLFTVVRDLPPHREAKGFLVVEDDFLVRDLIGLHGVRTELIAEIETKLGLR